MAKPSVHAESIGAPNSLSLFKRYLAHKALAPGWWCQAQEPPNITYHKVGQHTVAVLRNIVQSWRLVGPWIQRSRKEGTTNQAVKLCQKQFSDSPQQGCFLQPFMGQISSLSVAGICRRQKCCSRFRAGHWGPPPPGAPALRSRRWRQPARRPWRNVEGNVEKTLVENVVKMSILEISGDFQRCSSGWWCNNHLEKYEFVNGNDDIPYMKWKIKAMFETTNQSWFVLTEGHLLLTTGYFYGVKHIL